MEAKSLNKMSVTINQATRSDVR